MAQLNPHPGSRRAHKGATKEVHDLLAAVSAAGGDVRKSRGHWKVYLDGKYATTIPGTPGDHRGLKNATALLRRLGLPLTTKGTLAQ